MNELDRYVDKDLRDLLQEANVADPQSREYERLRLRIWVGLAEMLARVIGEFKAAGQENVAMGARMLQSTHRLTIAAYWLIGLLAAVGLIELARLLVHLITPPQVGRII